MEKGCLVGTISNFETFKIAPRKHITYIHIETLKSTNPHLLKKIQVECDFFFYSKARNLKNDRAKLIFVEYEVIKERVRKGRNQITVVATNFQKAHSEHFRQVDQEIKAIR